MLLLPGRFVRPVGNQGVEHIGDRDNARIEWNPFTAQAMRISAAIPAFMMGERDLRRASDHRPRAGIENAVADHSVRLDKLSFLGTQQARFVEQAEGQADFANIMQRRGVVQFDEPGRGEPGQAANFTGVAAHPIQMAHDSWIMHFAGLPQPDGHLDSGIIEGTRAHVRSPWVCKAAANGTRERRRLSLFL